MKMSALTARRLTLTGVALALGFGMAVTAQAQTGPSPARQAIDARKAVFTLIGQNCRTLGDVVKGNVAFDASDVQKRAARIALLSEFLNDTFPDVSNVGEPDTKTKAAAWTDKADFSKKIAEFQEHAAGLAKVGNVEKTNSEAFKAAFGLLAQDCKTCHDGYRIK